MPRPLFSHVLNLRQPSSGGGGAPTTAQYVVMALDGTLSAERVLTAGVGITITDGGANGPVTITNTGVPGTTGPKGPPGVDGDDGADGSPGPPGPQGAQGTIGTQGIQGLPGLHGWDGQDGEDGLPGVPGTQGVAGAQGAQGIQGLPGLHGWDGQDGEDGLPAIPGPQGVAGSQGIQGPPALHGWDGLDGEDGLPAIPGPQGVQGPTGSTGPQGPAGGVAAFVIDTDGLIDMDPVTAHGIPTYDPQDLSQLWWPSMQSFVAGTAETRNVALFNSTFTESPNAITHTFRGLRMEPTITAVPVGVGIANVAGFSWGPTMTMGSDVIINAVQGYGVYTNNAASVFGSFTLFAGAPNMVSTTATIAPYPAIVFGSAQVVQYNATGSASFGVSRSFQDAPTLENVTSGAFTVPRHDSYFAQPVIKQTAGTMTVTVLGGTHIAAATFASTTPTITAHVAHEIDNISTAVVGTAIGMRSAIVTSATNRFVQDTGGATSEFKGLIIQSYTPTSQTIPTGFFAEFAKRQQWTGTQRLTMQGTARLRGN